MRSAVLGPASGIGNPLKDLLGQGVLQNQSGSFHQPNHISSTSHPTSQSHDTSLGHENPHHHQDQGQQQPHSSTHHNHPPHPSAHPLPKLTSNLLATYQGINDRYYDAKKARADVGGLPHPSIGHNGVGNNGYDDGNSDYIVIADEVFKSPRHSYKLSKVIGKGSFGQVAKAKDLDTGEEVAIKIIKNKRAFYRQALTEVNILRALNNSGNSDSNYIVRMMECFEFRNHLCIVFELLSYNLYDLLRNTSFEGVSLALIRKFSAQILAALDYMRKDGSAIIHCDLKPENVLLRHPRRSAIKVIDFGSSCHEQEQVYTYIQSRFYRSPEVVLGHRYTAAIDMWSLGVMLVEMHTGEPLFSGQNEAAQVRLFVQLLGLPPNEMIVNGSKASRYFSPDPHNPGKYMLNLNPVASSRASSTKKPVGPQPPVVPNSRTLEEVLGAETGGPGGRKGGDPSHTPDAYHTFIDFISRMLVYDPAHRITPAEALQHPFIAAAGAALSPQSPPAVSSHNPQPTPMSSDSTNPAAIGASYGSSQPFKNVGPPAVSLGPVAPAPSAGLTVPIGSTVIAGGPSTASSASNASWGGPTSPGVSMSALHSPLNAAISRPGVDVSSSATSSPGSTSFTLARRSNSGPPTSLVLPEGNQLGLHSGIPGSTESMDAGSAPGSAVVNARHLSASDLTPMATSSTAGSYPNTPDVASPTSPSGPHESRRGLERGKHPRKRSLSQPASYQSSSRSAWHTGDRNHPSLANQLSPSSPSISGLHSSSSLTFLPSASALNHDLSNSHAHTLSPALHQTLSFPGGALYDVSGTHTTTTSPPVPGVMNTPDAPMGTHPPSSSDLLWRSSSGQQ